MSHLMLRGPLLLLLLAAVLAPPGARAAAVDTPDLSPWFLFHDGTSYTVTPLPPIGGGSQP